MDISRASRLGMLHRQLGIKSDSRIVLTFGENEAIIWDLKDEQEYVLVIGAETYSRSPKKMEDWMKAIFSMPDDALLQEFFTSGEAVPDEKTSTIATELLYRGVSLLKK